MCGWSSVRGRYYASSGEYWGVMSRENGGNPRGQKVKVFSLIVIWLSFLLVHLLWFLRSKRADFKHSYIAILSLKCLKHMIIRRLGPYLWRLSKSWLQTKTSHTYPRHNNNKNLNTSYLSPTRARPIEASEGRASRFVSPKRGAKHARRRMATRAGNRWSVDDKLVSRAVDCLCE